MRYIYCYIILLFFSSCNEDFFDRSIDLEVEEHNPLLVVSCVLSNKIGSKVVVVGQTTGILDPYVNELVTDASIFLEKDNVKISDFYYDQSYDLGDRTGAYIALSHISIEPRSKFEISVTADGLNPVNAIQIAPEEVEIQEISYEENNSNSEFVGNEVKITFADPPGDEQYYSISAWVNRFSNGGYFTDLITIDSPDPSVEAIELFDDGDLILLFRDISFDGKTYTMTFYSTDLKERPPKAKDKLCLSLKSITRDMFLYEKTYRLYKASKDNPFAEPVVVHSNIEGGAGIFGIEQISEMCIAF